MRTLLPALGAAQVAGLLLADQAVLGVAAALWLGALAVLLALCGLLTRRHELAALAALLLAAAAGACALAQRLEQAEAGQPRSAFEVSIEARVERAWQAASGPQLELTLLRALEATDALLPRRLWLSLDPDASLPQQASGSRLRARLRVAPLASLRNPGLPRDERRWLRRGVATRARLLHPDWWVQVGEAGALARLSSLRAGLGARLAEAGQGGALLQALGVGETSSLEPVTREAFRSLGISHLLSVSGLHLALVAGGVFALARLSLSRSLAVATRGDPGDVARLLALVVALLYAGLCGFGVPVRRALVMLIALVVSALRSRRAPRFHPLAAAALAVLALEPDALFQAGAQLSFAACAALLWGSGRLREASGSGLPRVAASWLRGALHGSSLAVAATAPLAAWHFGSAAPFAVLVNLVAIPWTGLVLLPAALLATLAAAAGEPLAALVSGLAQPASVSLWAVRWLAESLPGSRAQSLHPAVLLGTLAVAALTLRARTALGSAAAACLLGLCLCVAPPPAHTPAPPRVVAFDVGRGDAVLLQGRRGSLLVDGAAALPERFDLGASVVVPALRALGVERLDRVVATHADLDHRGGLPAVLRALPVDALWLPPGGREDPGFAELREVARQRGVPIEEVGLGSPAVQLGDLHVRPVWPPDSGSDARNERSLGLRVELAGRRVLLLGDLGSAEASLLASGNPLSADVLLLPHHGSGGSSSAALLASVAPQIVLVSAPCPPQRGLPRLQSLERARALGASVWWTGRDGAVFVGLAPTLVATPFAAPLACAGSDQRSMPSTSRS